jgi:hypothetical protein
MSDEASLLDEHKLNLSLQRPSWAAVWAQDIIEDSGFEHSSAAFPTLNTRPNPAPTGTVQRSLALPTQFAVIIETYIKYQPFCMLSAHKD